MKVTQIFAKMIPLILIMLWAMPLKAQDMDQVKVKIDEAVKIQIKEKTHVGIEVGLIAPGKKEFHGYGSKVLGGAHAPNENTVFEIGSISKVFTGVLLAGLVNDGILNLDEPISKIMPELQGTEAGAITLKQLTTHTSGLPRLASNLNIKDMDDPYAGYTAKDMIDFLKSYKSAEKGPYPSAYSNIGIELLGYVMSKATGLTYAELLKSKITGPLGMTDTTVNITAEQKTRAAQGYDSSLNKMPLWSEGSIAAAGGIKSTATDMLKFAQANLTPDNSPLGKAITRSHQSLWSTSGIDVGFNWMIQKTADGSPIIWHNGQTGGYHSMLMLLPAQGKALFYTTNTSADLKGLTDSLLNKPFKITEDYALSADEIASILGKYNIEKDVDAEISSHDGLVFIQFPKNKPMRIRPTSALEFNIIENIGTVKFSKDEKGKIQGLTLNIQGQTAYCAKVMSSL